LSSAEPPDDPLSLALAAAAHPIRRDILERVAREPQKVGALSSVYAVSLPAISRHLKTLERAHLIERRVEGRSHVIALKSEGLRRIAEWSATQSAEWAERLAKLKSLLEDDHD
jgi:DNA-binding transcriptional ArsR family regulator